MNVHDPRQMEACKKDPQCDVPFHQPGSVSGHPRFSERRLKTCPEMVARILGDNPAIQPTLFEARCPFGTSMVALVVDEGEAKGKNKAGGGDYHWYRKDASNYWSHKPGGTPVTDKDALGAKIYDPALASRDYRKEGDDLNYNVFCSYFCVPRHEPIRVKPQGGGRHRTRRQRRRAVRSSVSTKWRRTFSAKRSQGHRR